VLLIFANRGLAVSTSTRFRQKSLRGPMVTFVEPRESVRALSVRCTIQWDTLAVLGEKVLASPRMMPEVPMVEDDT